MVRQDERRSQWTPAWVAAAGMIAAVVAVEAVQLHLLPFQWWGLPGVAVFGAVVTFLARINAWLRTHAHRVGAWLAAAVWTSWVSAAGWSAWALLFLVSGTVLLAALAPLCRTPVPEAAAVRQPQGEMDRRPTSVQGWERLLQGLTRRQIKVDKVVPWEKPSDGERVHLNLPVGTTWRDLFDFRDQIAAARRLPQGCAVRVLEGNHQGEAVLDVMKRDCLADPIVVPEDYSPRSINDTFAVMYSPRGEPLEMCLREQSMIVGGAPGSGKTTLLHRLILWLARCTDTLIWVMDPNGGGVAEPWIGPWARGEASAPVVDWVADDEVEGAVMVAVASAIARDRKTSRVAVERKLAAKVNVLPVDRDLPAIVVVGDEGGELRQKANLLGQLAVAGLSRLAQIGRAEAVRVVMSVLRGTADLLDKGLRVNAALRICLRMEEEDEYTHVLGSYPGATRLIHRGSGYARRSVDPRPVFARSVDFARDAIERAAIALAPLRPRLDARGQLVASRMRARDVLDGKEPWPELLRLPVMQDVEAGRAYTGRWDRYAHKLAEMRGEEIPFEDEPEPPVPPARAATPPSIAEPGSALANLMDVAPRDTLSTALPAAASAARSSVELGDQAAIDDRAKLLLAELDEPKLSARELILAILADVHPEALTSDQIGTEMERRSGRAGNRTHRQDLLREMVDRAQIVRLTDAKAGGRYAVKR